MVGSIREVHRALRDSGYMISENWIRDRIRNGDIPSIPSGKKALISFEFVREYIDEKTGGRQHE